MSDDLTRLREIAAAAICDNWYLQPFTHEGSMWVEVRAEAEFDDGKGYDKFLFQTQDSEAASFIATFDPPTVTALLDRAERAERERDELAQAMWDGWAALGFDTDGDTHPGAWIAGAKSYRSFAEDWLRDVRQHRKEADEADAEWSQDIDRLDATVAELAALRAAVTGLADETGSAFPYVQVRELRSLLTDEGDNG